MAYQNAKIFKLYDCYRHTETGRIKQVMVNEIKTVDYVQHICCRFKPTIGCNELLGRE